MIGIKKVILIHVIFYITIVMLFFAAIYFVEYLNLDFEWVAVFGFSFMFLVYGLIGLGDYFRARDPASLETIIAAILFFIFLLLIT